MTPQPKGAMTPLSDIGELSLIADIRKKFSQKGVYDPVKVGIGDDAAVIASHKEDLVATTDMMLEGVHFNLSFITAFQIGFKLISVNVSDIYAMGGKPAYILLNIGIRGDTKKSFLNGFFDGIKKACSLYKLRLIGGDMSSSDNGMVVSATLIGYVKRPLRRAGAKAGDKIYVTGCLGDSSAGLLLLNQIKTQVDFKTPINKPLKWHIMEPLLKRHLMPAARSPEPFKGSATSMIDISDGLLIDLARLSKEGRVGSRLYEEKIPISTETRQTASYLGISPLRLALAGGEDYELLFTAPQGKKINAICIGEITKSGFSLVDRKGKEMPIKPEGYEHFKYKG